MIATPHHLQLGIFLVNKIGAYFKNFNSAGDTVVNPQIEDDVMHVIGPSSRSICTIMFTGLRFVFFLHTFQGLFVRLICQYINY